MKKIIFGLLSFLLISPVFADEISLNRGPESFISFEDLKSSHNITYGFYRIGGSYNTYEKSFTYYLDSSLVPQYSINYFDSLSTQSWVNYNTDLGSPFVISGSTYSTLSNQGNYFGLLGIGFVNGRLINSSFSAYFQSDNGLNKVINFSSEFNTGINFSQIRNSFVRVLYNYSSSSGLWFIDNNSPITPSVGIPSDIQLFIRNDDRVYTSKGMAGINQKITRVSSSVGNGFSFFPELSGSITWDSIKMYSVFPYWDSEFDGTFYSIPDSKYSSDFYIFKMNSLGRNTDYGHIGVISKCNSSICSGFDLQSYLSSLVFSEYYCDFSSNFGIKNNCNLVDGGFLYNILGSVTGLDSIIDINLIPNFLGNIQYYYEYFPSVGVNFNFSNRNLVFSYWTKSTNSNNTPPQIYSSSFSVSYTGIYNSTYVPDILGTYDYVNPLPPSSNSSGSLSPEESRDRAYNIICKLNPNNPVCKEFGYTTGSYDVSFTPDGSGGLLATVTLYDEDDGSCPDIYFTGSDGVYYHQYFDRVCYNVAMIPREDSTPQEDLTSDLTGLENNINLAFSGIFGENFKFYSCPFNSPLKAFHLSSIGGLSSFLLDKFFDVNLVGPFNCLLGGILYSETDSVSLGSRLLSNTYHGEKYFNNFPDDVKKTINWLLFAGMVLFFWSFRPKDH